MDFLYDDIFDNEYEDPASDMYYDDAMEADTADGSDGRFKALKDKIIAWFNSKIKWVQEKIRNLRGDEKSVWANLLSKIKSFFSKAKSADNPDDLVECQKMTQVEIDKTKGQILKAGGYKDMDARREQFNNRPTVVAKREAEKKARTQSQLDAQRQHRENGAKVGMSSDTETRLRSKYGERNAARKEQQVKAEARAKNQAEKRALLEKAAKGSSGKGVIIMDNSDIRHAQERRKNAEAKLAAAAKGQKSSGVISMDEPEDVKKKRKRTEASKKAAATRRFNKNHNGGNYDYLEDQYDAPDNDYTYAAEEYEGYDEEDIAVMEAIEEFYSYDPSVEAALEAMGTNLDIQCTTAQECLNYMDGLEGEISKFNLNLRTLKVAAENYRADGDQEKFNTIAGPALEQLQASYKALGLTSENEKFNEACIEQLNNFFLGAQDLIYAKADEFLDDSGEYDEDDYAGESFLSSLVY